MNKLGFSYTGESHSAVALFDDAISNDEAVEILQGWIEQLEKSDADIWPQ
jgi:hypothetical protein